MFTNISWSNYIVVFVLTLVSWYLFTGLRFYFNVLKDIVAGKRKLQIREATGKSDEESDYDVRYLDSIEIISFESVSAASGTIFEEVDALVKQLNNVLIEATQRKLAKQEFEDYMKLVLKKYPLLKESPYRWVVDELIVIECENHGPVFLTQQEVEVLWDEKS
ncbi:hypothetical protein [Flavobacterium sp. XS2P39]|uniref:hypothetical protein n=1 Tax=Flavobacterium sp. XS2P39 TaxID=3401725 RepID=UPI003AAC41F7